MCGKEERVALAWPVGLIVVLGANIWHPTASVSGMELVHGSWLPAYLRSCEWRRTVLVCLRTKSRRPHLLSSVNIGPSILWVEDMLTKEYVILGRCWRVLAPMSPGRELATLDAHRCIYHTLILADANGEEGVEVGR